MGISDDIYKKALLHAFFVTNFFSQNRTSLTHEIIQRDLNASSFYTDFLSSIQIVSLLLHVPVVNCSLEDFKENILDNIEVVTMIYKCWTHINDETNYRS